MLLICLWSTGCSRCECEHDQKSTYLPRYWRGIVHNNVLTKTSHICVVYVLVSLYTQMKKKLTKMEIKGWRYEPNSSIGTKNVPNNQIGQLLFYLVVLQLKRIQQYLQPSERESLYGPLTRALGVYNEEGMVSSYSVFCVFKVTFLFMFPANYGSSPVLFMLYGCVTCMLVTYHTLYDKTCLYCVV